MLLLIDRFPYSQNGSQNRHSFASLLSLSNQKLEADSTVHAYRDTCLFYQGSNEDKPSSIKGCDCWIKL